MSNLNFAIQDDIRLCVLSFPAIAKKHGVSVSFVTMIWEEMCREEFSQE